MELVLTINIAHQTALESSLPCKSTFVAFFSYTPMDELLQCLRFWIATIYTRIVFVPSTCFLKVLGGCKMHIQLSEGRGVDGREQAYNVRWRDAPDADFLLSSLNHASCILKLCMKTCKYTSHFCLQTTTLLQD